MPGRAGRVSRIGEGANMGYDTGSKSGWLGKFVALFVGVPPIAVLAADEDDEDVESTKAASSH